ncbi:Hypothetical protein CINCED_3A022713 [Cinara cedri]|uniref:Uncharacterized protein n=1 Tax=Cinara cedri TaxID=506608 RepID=A0A5E4MPJ1_9HEMI|nr:Hypothetical protein CINCED_3A022713 [Cinara cedri]
MLPKFNFKFFGGNASEEPANPVQTTEQERVEVNANNVVVSEEETTEQNSEEEFVEVNSGDVVSYADEAMEQAPSKSGIVSYALLAAKGGTQALYATALVMGYTLKGISYFIAGASHVPYEMSKLIETHKDQQKTTVEGFENTTKHTVLVYAGGFFYGTSGAMYGLSYIPYCAGAVLLQVAYASDSANKYLSPEKIEEICAYTNSLLQSKPGSLEEINVNSAAPTATLAA